MTKATAYSVVPTFSYRLPTLPLGFLDLLPVDRQQLLIFLQQVWMKETIVREAIRLASPVLAKEIDEWVFQERASVEESVVMSFLNYFLRMITRATPFGLFAGVGTGKIFQVNQIGLNPCAIRMANVHCRLDMGYLMHESNRILLHDSPRKSGTYRLADTAYQVGREIRYVSAREKRDGTRVYQLESVELNAVLDRLLEQALKPLSYASLVELIEADGYDRQVAGDFIDDLIFAGLLVAFPQPALTRVEYTEQVSVQLQRRTSGKEAKMLHHEIELASQVSCPADTEKLKNPGHFQFDLHRTATEAELPVDLAMKVLKGIRVIRALGMKQQPDRLDGFRKAFERRFGDRDVPLLLVMDQDYGIGLEGSSAQQQADPSDLLDDLIQFSGSGKGSPKDQPRENNWSERTNLDHPDYLDLMTVDLQQLDLHRGDWPAYLQALISLSGSKEHPEIHFVMAAEGHPAALLNRFGFLSDPGLQGLLRQFYQDEAAAEKDKIFAEIVHLPEGRTGNILQRKESHDHEICLMAGSILPESQVFRPADLLVRIDRDRVKLIHSTTGQEIIPTLHNAHNFSHNQLPVYEFLAEVGRQWSGQSFSLEESRTAKIGKVSGIRYGNLILRPTRWYLTNPLLGGRTKGKGQSQELIRWAKESGLPDRVVLILGDRHLYVDWNNESLVQTFIDGIRQVRRLVFECFRYEKGSPVGGSGQHYANEIIVCFRKN